MAQTYNLGKVVLTPRGDYNSNTQYYRLDIVRYAGSAYVVLQDVIGTIPTDGDKYMLLVSKGGKGDDGVAASVTVGTVTEAPAGTPITVTNTGTENNAIFNFTLAKGNMWYTGTACTGTSSTGTIFATGIANAGVGDLYLNTGIDANQGRIYKCVLGGDASTAKWAYVATIVASADGAVSYSAQSPTTAQKTQARTNIGAASSSIEINGEPLTENISLDASDIPTSENNVSVQDFITSTGTTLTSLGTGKADKSVAVSVTISVSDWGGTTSCTKTVSGVTSSNNIFVTYDPSSYEEYTSCLIRATAQGSGTVTFTCEDIPSTSVTALVLILG